MQGLVTVFGGSGFIGAQVVRALAKRGFRVRVAVRQPGRGYKLRMLGAVGQIQVVQANARDPQSVARALVGAQACVNLIGLLYESGRQKFTSVHVMGAQTIAQAAKAAGVSQFIQMSAIGAAEGSSSKYARTKAMGEAAVRKVFPKATILRPSIVFGPGDGFFNRFAAMACVSPVLPLFGGGKTRFQPVSAGDVGAAVAACVADPASTAGKTYELGGPATYTFKALMELVRLETRRKPMLLSIPFFIAEWIGLAGQIQALVMPPVLTVDQVTLLRFDNVADPKAPGLADLGVTPTALEAILPTYLARYRVGGEFADAIAAAAAR
jgi:NADH dehydrogenase